MYICNVCYQISRASGVLGFLGNFGYQGQDAIVGAVYAPKGCTTQLQRHGLHVFALDQPSINGFWSNYTFRKMEIVGNSRKRSETVGTMIRLNLSNPHFFNNRYFICFWKVQRCPKGNGWKRLETVGAPTFARSKRRKAHFR